MTNKRVRRGLERPSALETITGNPVLASAAAAFAAHVATPLAALPPVLLGTLAAKRHQQRVENAIREITRILETHDQELARLSDSQFKLISEAWSAVLRTTSTKKLLMLKNAIRNTLVTDRITAQEAALMSRVLRDITP